jgi:hypothetical protein
MLLLCLFTYAVFLSPLFICTLGFTSDCYSSILSAIIYLINEQRRKEHIMILLRLFIKSLTLVSCLIKFKREIICPEGTQHVHWVNCLMNT